MLSVSLNSLGLYISLCLLRHMLFLNQQNMYEGTFPPLEIFYLR